ncbi:TSUP family transporter [Actinotignum timonense]|uniref:TSUP family transporter n=1 Tax=Actinotignum timonense TaxID=1870995 RepID=UPI002A839DAB|nr:TSUP family transporter [Actinotignum timonense]MDY5143081.1 TSUP family transporter [Actinotignum timonense]
MVVTSSWALSVLVFATGLVGGIVGYLTGVASLVTYPALLALGFPPITANVTNAINNFGSSLGSVLTGWRSMRAVQAYPLWPQMFISAVGGAIGAVP